MKKPRTFGIDSTYVDRNDVALRNAYVAKEMDAWLAERDKELAQKLREVRNLADSLNPTDRQAYAMAVEEIMGALYDLEKELAGEQK